ncbi:MAG: ATP-binding cassette domain-containing protein [Clostridia bacterium]
MLEMRSISKSFNRGTAVEKLAINNLDFSMEEGDFVTVIGGNGAGKSTLLNLIAGVYPTDFGLITINGLDVTHKKDYERASLVSRVFQDPIAGTAGNMNIEENLSLSLRRGMRRTLRWGASIKEVSLYKEKLESLGLGLETRLNTKVGLLSGGQRQALTLLMATLTKPAILLLDEHTAALDPKTAQTVLETTKKITEMNNQTTLMVTHNMKDAIKYGNRLIMMHEGKIIFDCRGEDKKKLTVPDLLAKFNEIGEVNDRIVLN